MKKVMAQGTFDILHPGHLYYFEESAKLGEKLVVVIARDSRVKNRKNLCFDEEERKLMVQSLETVDKAILGSEDDVYSTVETVNPDVITLGYDQGHSEEKVKELAEKAVNHEVTVERVGEKKGYSSSSLKDA